MRVHILYQTVEHATGGGNQFLKALKKQLIQNNSYTYDIKEADIILYDSYQNLFRAVCLKYRYPDKIFVHRVGPVFHTYRAKHWRIMDSLMAQVANIVADVVVAQSSWTQQKFLALGLNKKKTVVVIHNAVDKDIFNTSLRKTTPSSRIRLIANSWSSNWNKGFAFYQYLDEHLDFEKYDMTFIGNSPITFKNISHIKPLKSIDLAKELQKHDIYISGVKDDACSNSIIEALVCGLPVIALDSGGNGELVGERGELFSSNKELMSKIEVISKNLEQYKSGTIPIQDMVHVSQDYVDAASHGIHPKNLSLIRICYFFIKFYYFKILNIII